VAVAWVLADPLLSNLRQILVTGYHPHVDLFHQLLFTRKIGIELGECALSLVILVIRDKHSYFPDSSVIQHKENNTDHSVIKQRPVYGLGLTAKHKNSRVRNSLLETM